MYKNIDKTVLFKGLNIKEIEKLLDKKEHFTKKFYKNNYIAYREDKTKFVMIILEGEIQTLISNNTGKIKNVIVLSKYSTIAPSFLFGNNNKFPVDVKSVDESLILYISKKSIFTIIQENPIVLNNYLNIISNKAQILSQKLWKGFTNNTIRKKILDYLQEHINQETMIIKFDKSLEELARYFDIPRPSLSRTLNEFIKNDDIEKLSRGKYLIKNEKIIESFYEINK